MRALKAVALFLLAAGPAVAQQTGGVVANGQVYLPNGLPARQEIRLYVEMESSRRPPYYVYTDLMGRFELRDIRTLVTYRITVDTDEETWATTTISFIPSGTNPRVDVFLHALKKNTSATNTSGSVSVHTLQQRVPPEARKEFDIALQFIKKNDFAAARPYLQQAIAIFPQYVDARNELAVALMRENKLVEAEEQLRTALQVDPVAVRPLMNLGLCLSRQEEWKDAREVLDKAVQLSPKEPNAHLLLGIALMKLDLPNDAEARLKKAYELGEKKLAQAQYYLATLYIQQKDYPRAAVALETYLRDNPEDPNTPQLKKTLEQLRSAPNP